MKPNEVEATVILLAQQGLDGVADMVGKKQLARVFFQDESSPDLVAIVVSVS